MNAALESHAVGRRYGSVVAVEDLSFSVEAGEILAVLGPNGTGKTTAIRVLTTILAPTTVVGIPSSRPAEISRRMGVLPEKRRLSVPPDRRGVPPLSRAPVRGRPCLRPSGCRRVAGSGRSARAPPVVDRALPPRHAPAARDRRPPTGPLVKVTIADRNSLNTGGIAPLVFGVPLALVALFVVVRARRRFD